MGLASAGGVGKIAARRFATLWTNRETLARRAAMKRLWPALVAALMVTGLAFAADDAAKTAAPAAPAGEVSAPRHAGDFEPSRLPAMLKQNEQLIARWEGALGEAYADDTKKALGEAITKAKEFRAGLERLSDAVQAGKEDEARQLTSQLREKRPALLQYAAILPTYLEIEQAKAMQAERGKDNPVLNLRCLRIIDLLKKRLELQKQIGAVNGEIWAERQALQESIEGAPVNAPAAEPPKAEPNKAEPKSAPGLNNSKAKPDDAT
jgi:uncharacterized protein YukE